MLLTVQGNWSQLVTRASVAADMSLRPYSPIDSIQKVTAPIQIIAGKLLSDVCGGCSDLAIKHRVQRLSG